MNATETVRYDMLGRLPEFGKAHSDRLAESSAALEAFAEVAAVVTRLDEHAISRMSATEERTNTRGTARNALRDCLRVINRTARVVGRDTPGLEGQFELPAWRSDQALITVGRLFARDAQACEAQFIAQGMPKTFIADLNGRIERLDQAIHTHEAGRDARTAVRVSIREALASGLAAAERLDVIVANHLGDDPVAMAVWKRDRRIGRPPRTRKKKVAAEEPAVTTPQAASGTAGEEGTTS